jgi:hypothetical protein
MKNNISLVGFGYYYVQHLAWPNGRLLCFKEKGKRLGEWNQLQGGHECERPCWIFIIGLRIIFMIYLNIQLFHSMLKNCNWGGMRLRE